MADKLTANIPGTQTTTMRATLISPTLSTEVPSITIKDDWVQSGRDAFSTGGAYNLWWLINREINDRTNGDIAIQDIINRLNTSDVDLSNYTTVSRVQDLIDEYFDTYISPYIDTAIEGLNLSQYVTNDSIQEFLTKVDGLPENFITASEVQSIVSSELDSKSLVTTTMLNGRAEPIEEDIAALETSIGTLKTDVASLETSIANINTTINQGLVTRDELNTLVGDLNTILDEIND